MIYKPTHRLKWHFHTVGLHYAAKLNDYLVNKLHQVATVAMQSALVTVSANFLVWEDNYWTCGFSLKTVYVNRTIKTQFEW